MSDIQSWMRIRALARHLGQSAACLEVCGYDDKTVVVGRRKVKRGTSPDEARRLVAQLREAIALAIKGGAVGSVWVRSNDLYDNDGRPAPVEVSADPTTWSCDTHRRAAGKFNVHLVAGGGLVPTYDRLVALMRRVPESAALLEKGIHEVVNTLYFLSPSTDNYDHATDHRATLREAFDGVEVKDRRTDVETDSGSYLVVTDDEADKLWDDGLDSYLDDGGVVPGADSPYFDREKWKRDARVDGRAHVLAGYDGNEATQGQFYIYRVN